MLECAIDTNGMKTWRNSGKLHRTDGPAVEYANGHKRWYFMGELHRTNGPAVIWANGYQEWWIFNNKFTKAEYNKQIIKGSIC